MNIFHLITMINILASRVRPNMLCYSLYKQIKCYRIIEWVYLFWYQELVLFVTNGDLLQWFLKWPRSLWKHFKSFIFFFPRIPELPVEENFRSDPYIYIYLRRMKNPLMKWNDVFVSCFLLILKHLANKIMIFVTKVCSLYNSWRAQAIRSFSFCPFDIRQWNTK